MYPFGESFEQAMVNDIHIHILWVVPITQAERDFKAAHGREALEQRFEEAGMAYWDPMRPSVV